MSNNKPIIGIIIDADFIHQRTFGGASGLILSLIDELNLIVKVFGIGYEGTIPWQSYRLTPMVSFLPVSLLSPASKIPMRLKCLMSFWRHRRRIIQSGVDVLYIHSPEIALPFLFGRDRLPVIFHQHGSENPMKWSTYFWGRSVFFQKIFDFIIYTVHRRADWTIVIDHLCLEQARCHNIDHKTSLTMNAIDTKKYYPNAELRHEFRRKMKIFAEEFIILFVGRLEEVKRVDRVVASLELLNLGNENDRYRLFIAGEGGLREELERAVINRGLSDNICFLGYVPPQELPGYYNMADVLALPSEMEGVPMVILEALACGTPVVASRVGGIPDIVRDGINGLTLDKIETQSMAVAIQQVCETKYSRREVAATVAGLSSEKFASNLLTIIKKILKEKAESQTKID